MKENIFNIFEFDNSILNNKVMVKLWDTDNNKWHFEVIDVKKQEEEAIISYSELLEKFELE